MKLFPASLLQITITILYCLFLFSSCSSDEPAFEELNKEEEVIPVDDLDISDTPCDFSLRALKANETLEIDCKLDLKGESITLKDNVKLVFKGGEIVNGTLNFSGSGKIDGDLLNHTLDVKGEVSLISDVFNFHPSRWDIEQGKVPDDIAAFNTDNIEELFNKISNIGGRKFVINDFDAFFKTDGFLKDGSPPEQAINIPSHFHLAMSVNTHLRLQPNGHFRADLLAIYNANNIKVTGGTLHGERDEHDYNSGFVDSDGATGKTNEWINTMSIKGGQDITIDGVIFMDATGDCLYISGIYHYFDERHIRSKNIKLLNNKFIRARRTNLVITSAEQVVIENNEFIDGGIDTNNSNGIAPSSNFNIEPVRGTNPVTGELIEYERVSHIFIKGNKQIVTDKISNPRAGEFQFSHGNGPLILEDNEMINTGVTFSTVDGLIVRNNRITGGGISAGRADNFDREDFVYGNEIYGNSVENNGNVALNVAGNGVYVHDNTLIGAVGVALGAGSSDPNKGVSNSRLFNNTIKASSRGITSMNTMHNVIIDGNTIEMLEGANFSLALNNKWTKSTTSNFIIKNNTVTGVKTKSVTGAPPSLIAANSIEILNNKFGDIQLNSGASNVVLKNNEIDANIGANGILFYSDVPNSTFLNNKITLYTSKTPLKIYPVKIVDNVQLSSTVLIENNTVIEN